MTDGDKTNAPDGFELDSFFAAARETEPMPSGEFMARIEADALAALPGGATQVVESYPSLWQQLLQAVGGIPGATGLAAACMTGVWIGVASPESFTDAWSQTADTGLFELDPSSGFDLTMMEG